MKERYTAGRLTNRALNRMRFVLRARKRGDTLEEIGRSLKVTRERVRQLEKLAIHLQEKGRLMPKPKDKVRIISEISKEKVDKLLVIDGVRDAIMHGAKKITITKNQLGDGYTVHSEW